MSRTSQMNGRRNVRRKGVVYESVRIAALNNDIIMILLIHISNAIAPVIHSNFRSSVSSQYY